jgi:cellulose synthase/poly-beta-1,6-N-acetylglucosamine synthase-like glycosyltransferase
MGDERTAAPAASVIVPAYNAGQMIPLCLAALTDQTAARDSYEVIVVDDGSTDGTAEGVARFPGVRLVRQPNQGPAAARNQGARLAAGDIIVFTDADCVPARDWLERMLEPFGADPDLAGAKGAYRTSQTQLVARFVQIEYEDKYDLLRRMEAIDFIDTYSAAYRREVFLRYGGYDTGFPVACAEDIELSYRMSRDRLKMLFIPGAVVCHRHPATLNDYLRKKHKFAYWRLLAVRKNPEKMIRDSHTPQLMKLQLLLPPLFLLALTASPWWPPAARAAAVLLLLFCLASTPFVIKALRRDPVVGLLSPLLLLGRAGAQFLGVIGGFVDWMVLKKRLC